MNVQKNENEISTYQGKVRQLIKKKSKSFCRKKLVLREARPNVTNIKQ